MIKADVTIAEQRQIVDVPVETKSEAIRVLWNTYGIAIEIHNLTEVKTGEEVEDETISDGPDNVDKPSGKGD
ncbi:hypothetical protein Si121_00628 [Streptococcus infantarius subsp. infantarius]|nr:hypothetical protein [Streptococcus infantarius subsp. infantarius]